MALTYLHACSNIGFALGNQKAVDLNLSHPTGQNYTLELMFTELATAKNREKVKPANIEFPRCYLPENITGEVYYCEKSAL